MKNASLCDRPCSALNLQTLIQIVESFRRQHRSRRKSIEFLVEILNGIFECSQQFPYRFAVGVAAHQYTFCITKTMGFQKIVAVQELGKEYKAKLGSVEAGFCLSSLRRDFTGYRIAILNRLQDVPVVLDLANTTVKRCPNTPALKS